MEYSALLNYASGVLSRDRIKIKEPMSHHTSFRVGGPAEVLMQAETPEELASLIRFMNEEEIPFFILGKGTNLLVSDEGYPGVILKLGKGFSTINTEGNFLNAGASAALEAVSDAAMEAGLTGLEFASGIPGSLGGGVVMNAGAYGGEMSQVIHSVQAMNRKGEILTLKKEEMRLGYRTSIFKEEKYIVLWVSMELKKGKTDEIFDCMEEFNRLRREKQPLEYPSAGSTFKRPEGYFAGKLIMDAGLRGFSMGGAQVSEKHCGFIINKENATASDILELMTEVQRRVKEQFGVELEPEVITLGK